MKLIAVLCALASVPTNTVATRAPLLLRQGAGQQGPMFGGGPRPPRFFYNGHQTQQQQPSSPSGHEAHGCHPKCWWSCGASECDEACEPVCAPPRCETACPPISLATCSRKCDPPKCAIVCPSMHCEHGDCPKCMTVCGPPKCSTSCSEQQCESKCAEPQCTWKCNPVQCEEPKCTMKCDDQRMCNLDKVSRPAPFKRGMTVVSNGLAAYDPSVLNSEQPAAAAPSAPGQMAGPLPAEGPAAEAPAARDTTTGAPTATSAADSGPQPLIR